MLGAGLRREFPGAFAWADGMRRRVPYPTVSRSGVVWGVLAGLGAKALAAAAIGAVASTLVLIMDPRDWRDLRAFEIREGFSAFAGGAIGLAVTFRAGGWRAGTTLIAVLAATAMANDAATAPGRSLFCERSGGMDPAVLRVCAPRNPIDEILARWPLLTGLAAGFVVARRLGSGRSGSNASLEAIGAVALGQTVVFALSTLFFAPGPAGTPETTPLWTRLWTIVSVLTVALALFGGHLLVRRGQKPWPAAAVLGTVFFVAPWLPTLYYSGAALPSDAPAEHYWLRIAPVASAIVFLLASIVTAAFAPPRPPDAGAARRAAR